MGRKSALTPEQWLEVERRILIDGETPYKLAQEYGVNESSIRRKIKPNKADKAEFGEKRLPQLRTIAAEKVLADAESKRVDAKIAELPYGQQGIVNELARKLTAISNHLGSAAEYGAATAHRLAAIAHSQVEKVDDAEPEKSSEALQRIAVLTKMANSSSEIGLNLLRANKETVDEMNKDIGNDPIRKIERVIVRK